MTLDNEAKKARNREYSRRWRESEKGRVYRKQYNTAEQRERRRENERARAKTPEARAKLAAKQRAYREAHAEYMRLWRHQNPEAAREVERRRKLTHAYLRRRCEKYGITPEQYLAMAATQRGLCAICKEEPSQSEPLCVDHCHTTGAVRGLLCKLCNLALGNFRDDVGRIQAALIYMGATP